MQLESLDLVAYSNWQARSCVMYKVVNNSCIFLVLYIA